MNGSGSWSVPGFTVTVPRNVLGPAGSRGAALCAPQRHKEAEGGDQDQYCLMNQHHSSQ
jgi:hypothetical protein